MPKIIKPSKGAFTLTSLSVDSSGRVYDASTGSAGGAGATVMQVAGAGPASGTYEANPATSTIVTYVKSGGGGGGASMPNEDGGPGGDGLFACFASDISQPFSQPYTAGAGGIGNDYDTGHGTSGGASGVATIGTANGGNAGGGGGPNTTGGSGTDGTAPGSSNSVTITGMYGTSVSEGGAGANPGRNKAEDASSDGFLVVLEDR